MMPCYNCYHCKDTGRETDERRVGGPYSTVIATSGSCPYCGPERMTHEEHDRQCQEAKRAEAIASREILA